MKLPLNKIRNSRDKVSPIGNFGTVSVSRFDLSNAIHYSVIHIQCIDKHDMMMQIKAQQARFPNLQPGNPIFF